MRFTLVVHDIGQASRLAQRFIFAALADNHQIEQVFFYHDGVYEGDTNPEPAQDDPKNPHKWQNLAQLGRFPLNLCVSAGARRGVFNESEATRLAKPAANLAPRFELVGLGVFIDGLINADRVVTFGN